MNDFPEAQEGKKDRLWLELLQDDVDEKISAQNIFQQQMLNLKIEVLKYQVKLGMQIPVMTKHKQAVA